MTLRDRDLQVLWHPASHFDDHRDLPPIPIARARGCWLYDQEDRPILDAIASWWTSIHGHCHPEIAAAIAEQAARLDHVLLAGFTHEPAVALAEALLAAAPPGMGRVFYADCGAAAVEVALKLSFQARLLAGEPQRGRFATLENSYHGETLGALALCGNDSYRATFAPLLMPVLELPAPELPDHDLDDLHGDAGADAPAADRAVELLEQHAPELSALILEPLVQCAGRMRMTGVGYYRRVVQAAQRLGIHVIADEIAVGFGRTGRLFASAWAGVSPDLLCLSKGLSGGVLPLAAVLVRAGLDDLFRGGPERSFLHSHTFAGNPIACAAGLASLRLYFADDLPARLPTRAEALRRRRLRVAAESRAIAHHRQAGMIAAFTVRAPDGGPLPARIGLRLRAAALARGVLLRPLHDIVYWMPPLTISDEELDLLADRTLEALREVLG
ncbi:MAG: adenosylmethionine--8-amino-7-oxononanoate transaminase [Nannocystis sp.]|nr:adenosylmethionine--8-amino-7-oxononanoate transaminase [Nannocystis sp.]